MIRKESKHSAGMGSRIQGGNLEKLISEILKFRDKRDWAQFHDLNNFIGLNVRWHRYYRVY